MSRVFSFICLLLLPLVCSPRLEAGQEPIVSVQEYYSDMMSSLDDEKWGKALSSAKAINKHFPTSPFAQDAKFYEGVALFHKKSYESANRKFTNYLQKVTTMKHFEEAIQYKFDIADKFRCGTKAHLFGFKMLPRMISREEQAIQIYDEVISSLPHHDLAARALYGKGMLLCKDREYRSGVETFQTLIRRFPKHPLSVEGYIEVTKAYFLQCKNEYPDPDVLDLAEINVRKFRQDFPGEEGYEIAEGYVSQTKEIFAGSFYDIGQYYERIKKWNAAKIYYLHILRNYPYTETAMRATARLDQVEGIIATGFVPWWKKITRPCIKQRVDKEERYNFALLEGEEKGVSLGKEFAQFCGKVVKGMRNVKPSLKQRAFDEEPAEVSSSES